MKTNLERILAVRDRNQINIEKLTKSYTKTKNHLSEIRELIIEAKQLQAEVEEELKNIKSSLNSE